MMTTTASADRGRRTGWTYGWLGGFIWVTIFVVVALVQGKLLEAAVGVVLVAAAVGAVQAFAPWRHPTVPYRRLMLPIYLIFFAAIGWGVWLFGSPRRLGLNWWSLFLILPLTLPLWTVGSRRWQDDREAR